MHVAGLASSMTPIRSSMKPNVLYSGVHFLYHLSTLRHKLSTGYVGCRVHINQVQLSAPFVPRAHHQVRQRSADCQQQADHRVPHNRGLVRHPQGSQVRHVSVPSNTLCQPPLHQHVRTIHTPALKSLTMALTLLIHQLHRAPFMSQGACCSNHW